VRNKINQFKCERMLLTKKGYTLIELLVVVMIIGVLASLGVANYFDTVKSSRIRANAFSLKPLAGAEMRYYYETGTYTKNIDDLDTFVAYNSKTDGGAYADYYTDWGYYRLFSNDSRVVGGVLYDEDGESKDIRIMVRNINDPNSPLANNSSYKDCALICLGTSSSAKRICASVGGTLVSGSVYCIQ